VSDQGCSTSSRGRRPDSGVKAVPPIGIFETVLALRGVVQEWPAHRDRLDRSAIDLYDLRVPLDLDERVRAVITSRDVEAMRIRIDAIPLERELACTFTTSGFRVPNLDLNQAPPHGLWPFSVPAGIGSHKWRDRSRIDEAAGALELAQPASTPSKELLVLGSGEEVLETDRGNLFIVRDRTLITPPADGKILPGIIRAVVLELAVQAGLPVEIRPVHLTELQAADECFVTSSLRGIAPTTCWQGRQTWAPGPVTGKLLNRLGRRWGLITA
jgi:para-aminobenzoate synthetase / 4-amino-4-deoxychorismate lyase